MDQNGCCAGIPFGVAQIGKAYRNEIAPRAGLIRQREFNQAEIEFFVDPDNKDFEKFAKVKHLNLTMFPSPRQLGAHSDFDAVGSPFCITSSL